MQDVWRPVDTYVDSGAGYTTLHSNVADRAGFDYRRGTLSYAQVGDGSLIPIFVHRLEVQLGPVRFPATIAFSERLGIPFNVLGRAEVFSRFTVCVQERQNLVSFETDQ
jgi:hypothetical protein